MSVCVCVCVCVSSQVLQGKHRKHKDYLSFLTDTDRGNELIT